MGIFPEIHQLSYPKLNHAVFVIWRFFSSPYLTAREKGASSWLNTLPLQQYDYTLNKEEFCDMSAYATAGGYQALPSPVDVGKQVILTTFSSVS